jgi:crotonobetainyl-CoA:carnitine CoA-transferase CaiB-like acyl-CoA transferase
MGPLKGIRVLDLSRFQACPLCGMMLADMGADVIRIESPGGAPDRTWGQTGPDGETLLYKIVARNKKSITLRLRTPQGMEIFKQLVEKSDVVLHNYTPGAPIAKEISYERLKETNPAIIVAMVSGYGQTGPDANNPCFDAVAQARSGGMVLTGFPGDPPVKTTVTYIDVSTGLLATIGVLLALHHREKTGMGQDVDVSLFDTASFATQCLGTLLLYNLYGDIRRQVGNRGFHSYIGCVEAKDHRVLISPATNSIWKRFTKVIGREDMATNPNFKTDMDRFNNASLIDPIIKEWAASRTANEIVDLMNESRVPCGIVNTIDQSLTDPQIKAREMIKFMDYPGLGEIPIPGIPIKLSSSPGSIDTAAPKLGEHNNDVYCELLGFDKAQLSILKRDGVV